MRIDTETVDQSAALPSAGTVTVPEPRLARGTSENLALDAREARRLVARRRGESGVCPGLPIETIADPVLIISTQGVLLSCNAAAERLIGAPRAELLNRPAHEVLRCAGPGIDQPLDFATQLGVRHLPADGSAQVIRRDGRAITVEAMLSPDLGEDVVIAVVRCTAAPSLRDEDVVAIEHDLRGPLAVVALEVAMLEDKLPVPARPEARRSLTRIARNLAFLDRMLHDLLDLAAIDAAKLTIEWEPVELSGLVADVIERVVSSRDAPRVVVETAGVLVVGGDSPRLERVICNLVQNALKYTPRASRIEVRVEQRDDYARVSVIDSGPGLPPDLARRVFERFTRSPSTSHHEGAGLGLFVSRKIIEAHGGRIGVDSVFGKGARFFFELPLGR